MTQAPPPPPPANVPPGAMPPGAMPPGAGYGNAPRSSIPKVLGIIGIVYGVLVALLNIFRLISGTTYGLIMGVIGIALAGLLIFGCVQLMNYRALGATLVKAWSALAILFVVIGLIATIVGIGNVSNEQAMAEMTPEQRQQIENSGMSTEDAMKLGKGMVVGGAACLSVVLLVLPVLNLILLSKQNVKASLTE